MKRSRLSRGLPSPAMRLELTEKSDSWKRLRSQMETNWADLPMEVCNAFEGVENEMRRISDVKKAMGLK